MRLSAGKQMHPFFTCRKETKRLTESLDIQKLDEGGQWSIYASDDSNIYPPFHILDTQVGAGYYCQFIECIFVMIICLFCCSCFWI